MNFNSFDQLAAEFAKRGAAARGALNEATKEHTDAIYAASKARMNAEIYGNPAASRGFSWQHQVLRTSAKTGKRYKAWTFKPRAGETVIGKRKWQATEQSAERTRKGGGQHGREAGKGRAQWVQTGNLRASERARMVGDEGHITNTASYAVPRHELGLSAGDPRSLTGRGSKRHSTRIAPWRSEAVADEEPKRLERYRKRLWAALTR